MKKIIMAVLCLSCLFAAQAQEARKVVKAEPQLSDVFNVLEMMDVHLFRFDLKSFLDRKYAMSVYVDEYKDNKKIKRSHSIKLGNNIEFLNDLTKKERDEIREQEQMPEGKNEWERIKELSVYVRGMSDSTSTVTIVVPQVVKTTQWLRLRRIGEFKRNFYQVRPFIFQEMGEDAFVDIPLVLYGSGWYDEKYNVVRFCGEQKIDPDMKAEILAKIPHHYVLGLELKSVKRANE